MPLREAAFRTLSQLTRLALYVGGLALTLAAAGTKEITMAAGGTADLRAVADHIVMRHE